MGLCLVQAGLRFVYFYIFKSVAENKSGSLEAEVFYLLKASFKNP